MEFKYVWENGEMLFAMECFGDIPTRQGKINKFIILLRDNPNTSMEKIANYCGFSLFDLTIDEISFIRKELNM